MRTTLNVTTRYSETFPFDCADKTVFESEYTKYTTAGTQPISVSDGKLLLQSFVNGMYSTIIQDMTSFPITNFTMTENIEVPKNMNIIGSDNCSLHMYMGTGSFQFAEITINTDIQSSLYKYRFIFRMLNAAGTEVKSTIGAWAEIGSETLKGRLKLVKSAGTITFYFDKDFTGTYTTIETYTHSEFTGIPNRIRHDLKFVTGADSAYMKIDSIIFSPDEYSKDAMVSYDLTDIGHIEKYSIKNSEINSYNIYNANKDRIYKSQYRQSWVYDYSYVSDYDMLLKILNYQKAHCKMNLYQDEYYNNDVILRNIPINYISNKLIHKTTSLTFEALGISDTPEIDIMPKIDTYLIDTAIINLSRGEYIDYKITAGTGTADVFIYAEYTFSTGIATDTRIDLQYNGITYDLYPSVILKIPATAGPNIMRFISRAILTDTVVLTQLLILGV